ncbi:hypothetical protein FJN17_33250 [Bradyrhizobium symbiodeficiens]|uniref:Uncharacterized protein n=1 Tax=Bradyrhizobium symbiodeficiens TaxID=1404367 RepID=A0ABX5WFP3_9BRAD|nr:hypothetical protein [Bradyrhizobium symbiodeficiens]QDF42068.1 hypothetical protein FJN17_33250 [Bradyrhizobium symbiodeficiens]
MNHSIYSADRATHLKILFVALVMASVSVLGLLIGSSKPPDSERSIVLKAGRSITVASTNAVIAR